MSIFLTTQSLALSHSSVSIFKDITFSVKHGDKIGLIGHNGCGKSSLLKLLNGDYEPNEGHIAKSKQCLISYIQQHIPNSIQCLTILEALSEKLTEDNSWRAEILLVELGFSEADWQMPVANCSGGQQMRLLLACAIINEPDLLLLDEPSNHLDLSSLIWLEQFLIKWKGSFILVSHDQALLDSVTNTTLIMRDESLYSFALPCTQAREELIKKDEQDKLRYNSEQKEIDRIEKSAKRLATWGKVYDNEDLARKSKTMFARKERLEIEQTELSHGAPWVLRLQGEYLPANRLVDIGAFNIDAIKSDTLLFKITNKQIKSGDRIAVLGNNGCGKSTLLNIFYNIYSLKENNTDIDIQGEKPPVVFHDKCRLGYYDQSQNQLNDNDTLVDALINFASISIEQSKLALIGAGFEYKNHNQNVSSLSGGERSRLMFVGLTLANHHLLFLDEPTNHLDMDGKENLIEALNEFKGAALLVSHDRNLIEQSCNRFWFIQDRLLTEYLNAEDVYDQILNQSILNTDTKNNCEIKTEIDINKPKYNKEEMLERLIELETMLEDDLNRKEKHQKINLQKSWRYEIDKIMVYFGF